MPGLSEYNHKDPQQVQPCTGPNIAPKS